MVDFGDIIRNYAGSIRLSISVNGALNYDGTYTAHGDKNTVTVSGLLGEVT